MKCNETVSISYWICYSKVWFSVPDYVTLWSVLIKKTQFFQGVVDKTVLCAQHRVVVKAVGSSW